MLRPGFLIVPVRRTLAQQVHNSHRLPLHHRIQPRPVQLGLPTFRIVNVRPYSSSSTPTPNPNENKKDVKPQPLEEDPIPVPNTIPPLPIWQRLGPLTSLASAYGRAQRRRPWVTQFFSVLVIYFISDRCAQTIGGDEYDPKRTLRSLIIGGGSAIPSYLWFVWLSHSFNYSSHILSIATKIVVSQLLFTPTFNTYFFGSQAVLSGCTPSEVLERVYNTVPTSMVNSCKFWPWVTAFTFTFIPIQYRSLFSGVIAIGWQTYLAWLNRMAELKESAGAADHLHEAEASVGVGVGDVE
ncbi:unnamed protein product [Clonostachys chloroleuca]|uniref:Uncharacterized protein n=1 Tax=Clonostachys chloroleuca TaxID=1926264 RepID=A0AA35MAJ0_9HYPO|nr:unnamed protein product [Clonostachys chloroleuca]